MPYVTTVFTTTSVIGFHQWPDAPDEVDYLRERHRHKFGIRVEVEVTDDDRQIEFHILKRLVNQWLHSGVFGSYPDEITFGPWSCERIANQILNQVMAHFGEDLLCLVSVDEDGENGAIVRYKPA